MKTKVLITVKTYPTLSATYDELVCTAGFREDGSWIRIYPIPFRKLDYDRQYSKYQWIELDLVRNHKDPRPESFRPVDYQRITLGQKIGTDNGSWSKRREIVLKKVYFDLGSLIAEAKNKDVCTSLAVFKPSKVFDFVIEKSEKEWDPKKVEILERKRLQLKLFPENPFKVVRKLPYKFSYRFEDCSKKEGKLMIEDWEIGQLFWNCLRRHQGNEEKACMDVRKKYFDDFVKTKDLHFYLGTTREFHFMAPNPFIIGAFYPKS